MSTNQEKLECKELAGMIKSFKSDTSINCTTKDHNDEVIHGQKDEKDNI